MQLSVPARRRAVGFIEAHARPLERALHAFHFEAAKAAGVQTQLASFQNGDGGFGHGVEPDLSAADSSAICTTRALQTLIEVGTPAAHPLVRGGVAWLLAALNRGTGVWEIVPPAVNGAPHAGWWHYDDAGQADKWGGYRVNPRAEIVGCLHQYSGLVPAGLLSELTDALIAHLEADPQPGNMHDIACYLALIETPSLPEALRSRLVARLRAPVERAVERDPAKWKKYCLRPASYMGVVNSPKSPFAESLAKEVGLCIDYVIGEQCADGSWQPTWSWGAQYPEAWERAKLAWQGILTVKTLRLLAAFGRLPAAG